MKETLFEQFIFKIYDFSYIYPVTLNVIFFKFSSRRDWYSELDFWKRHFREY